MFEAIYCDIHSRPAKQGEAHLDITQTAKPYNKEECLCSHGLGVCNVHWRMGCKYTDSRLRVETPSGHELQFVSG